MPSILERFYERHPRSARFAEQGRSLFPDGVTHDIRRLSPFPIYVDHAFGSRKWDVDGNEIIDYVMGHGALLLGHAHPAVVDAVEHQLRKGTHYGASHELELRWAGLIKRLVPSAELVRFTSSGTEATMMALRLARAATGRNRVVKFEDHFHGWHDYVVGERTEMGTVALGVPPETLRNLAVLPANDLALVERTLAQDGSIGAVILEPTGAAWGTYPLAPGFLQGLREITRARGAVLIFDEVITGFRASPGGAQLRLSVMPDLTTMAKIVAGGLPGGAVTGRAELLGMIDSHGSLSRSNQKRVAHPGTFNANPLSSAAAVACLELVATGEPPATAEERAVQLVDGLNNVFSRLQIPGRAYGLASMVHFVVGRECPSGGYEWPGPATRPPATDPELSLSLKRALLNEGVDPMGNGAMVSSVHTRQDIDDTIDAFGRALSALKAESTL